MRNTSKTGKHCWLECDIILKATNWWTFFTVKSLTNVSSTPKVGWWVVVVLVGETATSGQNDVHPLVSGAGAGGIPPLTTADHPCLVDHWSVKLKFLWRAREGEFLDWPSPPIVESRPLKIFWYTSVRESSDHISPVIGWRSVWRGSFTSHMTIWCWKNSNGSKRCDYQVVDFSNVEWNSRDEKQNVLMSLKYPPLLNLFCSCFTSFHPVT